MDIRLRNMTSVYLTDEEGILCLYRMGSRVANNLLLALPEDILNRMN